MEKLNVIKEYYFAILLDRVSQVCCTSQDSDVQGPIIVASSHGGMDIEAVAHDDPDSIIKEPIDFKVGA